MNEPVGEVEVELSVEGNPEGCQDEHCCVPGAREGLSRKSPDNIGITEKSSDPKEDLLVGEIRKAIGGVTVDEDRLPHRELEDAHRGVEHVVDHLGQLVSPIGYKRALRPPQQIEDTVPESKEPKCDSEVHSKPL